MDGPDLSRIESADSKMQTPSTMRMGVPRIDTEPMFTALKAAIGESWPEYKTTLSSFFLGKLNQAELSQVTDRLLSYAPSVSYNGALVSTVHLHNKIFGAIHSNIYRDPPPEPVASWVLATDAPASASANKSVSQGGGDKAEERLKREVMALSARDRRRIKSAKDNLAAVPPSGPLHENATYATALTVPITSSQIPDAIPTTATSLSKTNWDLEIRRRYAVPLASETLDFPSRADIQARIEPICYEEGVGLSAVPMTSAALQAIAELVEVATETFIKEKLTAWFSTTRSNAPGDLGPITAKFRAQMRREEEAIDRGQLGRSAAGFLPCEQEALTRREPLSLDEVRMSLRLDDTRLRLDPFLGEEIMGDVEMEMVDTPMALTNGDHHEPLDTKEADGDAMVTDDDDLGGWEGATAADRDNLFSVLDSNVGSYLNGVHPLNLTIFMANSSTPNPNAPDNGSRATYTENLPRRLRSSGPIAGSSSSTTAGSSSSLTAGSTSSTTAGSTSSIVPPHDPAVPTPAPPSDPAYFRCDKAIEDGTQCTWDFGTQIQLDNHVKSTRHAKLEICPICPTTGPLRKMFSKLSVHVAGSHPGQFPNPKIFRCPQPQCACGPWKQLSFLLIHIGEEHPDISRIQAKKQARGY
ncbi:putative transcriptional co-activator [Aureobasidium pullulans]|nr:putative transcriptional co-activator [Aureobasidium pullulans]